MSANALRPTRLCPASTRQFRVACNHQQFRCPTLQRSRMAARLAPCRAEPGQEDNIIRSNGTAPPSNNEQQWRQHYNEPDSPNPSPLSGGVVAGIAVVLAITAAAGPLLSGGPSLAKLEQQSVPLEVALGNKKPTVIEFYASWCEVCKDLVPDETRVEQRYHNDINFVMLNIENSKWAPEMADYGVGGVPHFVFLDKNNEPLAAAVGRLPRKVLEGNVQALAEGRDLPFLKAFDDEISKLDEKAARRQANPRDHA